MKDGIKLISESGARRPALETSISRVILEAVADGKQEETLRLYRTPKIVAFGPQDINANGYRQAVQIARSAGFACVQRLAGGRAAVFHEGTLAFAWAIPDIHPKQKIRQRFQMTAEIVSQALIALGVRASVGAVDGEYCPGEFSVNARGKKKIMGVGQRVIANASHMGGLIVLDGSSCMKEILIPVYSSLGLEWNPETVGSVEDEVGPIPWQALEDSIVAELSKTYRLDPVVMPDEIVRQATTNEHNYVCPDFLP